VVKKVVTNREVSPFRGKKPKEPSIKQHEKKEGVTTVFRGRSRRPMDALFKEDGASCPKI